MEKLAMVRYNDILHNIVEPKLGKNTTYSDTLEKVGKEYLGVRFKGVFPSDKIPRLNDLSPYCIVNVDKSTQPGSHWMAVVKDKNDAILYDSFGRKDTLIIPSLQFSGNGRIINTDSDPEQKRTEDNCGARAISFLIFYNKYGKEMSLLI